VELTLQNLLDKNICHSLRSNDFRVLGVETNRKEKFQLYKRIHSKLCGATVVNIKASRRSLLSFFHCSFHHQVNNSQGIESPLVTTN
jgi:hypothetical protein